ncbi:glycosyltransferase [Mucilaginibacter sp. BJC16-A38]|uniref:glycosyltransferase family 2 protein n=1 Tax=Mucilaginibacter phenanthrenivorans TaxID=1234842 RepID=UPI0021588B29|nr:glycosyltransferase family 2 protein [Mucilaginibacter phenanthrenivorans]MCR8559721.1 glycosyltransferase [Mucilaginibacter phenanthrenivorans]
MSTIENPLLTIAIPTYNRSVFLDRALSYLSKQLKNDDLPVEVIVSDNCSIDDTENIVTKHIKDGLNIQYFKNAVNKGMDFNIAQCYLLARGKYVLALGDDDFLLEGSLKLLTELLTGSDYGDVYFKSSGYNKNSKDSVDADKFSYEEFSDPLIFIKKVHYYITFISGNIVNTKYLDREYMLNYLGTSLPQVPFILEAIISAPKNAIINTVLLGVELDNTGGYNLFKVFGRNFNKIIDEARAASPELIKKIKKVINRNLLIGFFPDYILRFRTNYKNDFIKADPINELQTLYKGNFYFYLCCYPIAYLPKGIARIYRHGIKLFSKLRKLIS